MPLGIQSTSHSYHLPKSESLPLTTCHEILGEFLANLHTASHFETLTKDVGNELVKFSTLRNTYLLRQYNVDSPPRFAQMLTRVRLASQLNIGPKIFGWNETRRAYLMQYIKIHPQPNYLEDPKPYVQTMLQLRRLHVAQHEGIDQEAKKQANFPLNLILNECQQLKWGFPPQIYDAVLRVTTLFKKIEPRLTEHATFIHGNLSAENVLHCYQGQDWNVYFVDFEHSTIAHPYVDIAQFCLRQSLEQRRELLRVYLGTSMLSTQEQMHLDLCRATLILRIALAAFQDAHERIQASERSLSGAEIQEILHSKHCPFVMEFRVAATSARDSQRMGTYALREVMAIPQEWLLPSDCEAISNTVRKMPEAQNLGPFAKRAHDPESSSSPLLPVKKPRHSPDLFTDSRH